VWPGAAILCIGVASFGRWLLRLPRRVPARSLLPDPRTRRQFLAASVIVPVTCATLLVNDLWLICCPERVVPCATVADAATMAGWEPVLVRLPSGSFAGQFPYCTSRWWRAHRGTSALPESLWEHPGADWPGHPLAIIEPPHGQHPFDPRVNAIQNPWPAAPEDPAVARLRAPMLYDLATADPYDGSARMFRGLNLDDGFLGVVVMRPSPSRLRFRWHFKADHSPPHEWRIARLVPEATLRSFALREMWWALGVLALWVLVGAMFQRKKQR
jgi:hypothetical protein